MTRHGAHQQAEAVPNRTTGACRSNRRARLIRHTNQDLQVVNPSDKPSRAGTPHAPTDPLAIIFAVQSFHLANGKLRCYVTVAWNSGKGPKAKTVDAFGAWISPSPKLHILTTGGRSSPYDGLGSVPNLDNVMDLGGGKTGIIVSISAEDSYALNLYEYRKRRWHQGYDCAAISLVGRVAQALKTSISAQSPAPVPDRPRTPAQTASLTPHPPYES